MDKAENERGTMKVSSAGRGGCLSRLLGMVIVVAVIVAVASYFAVRTAGFRDVVKGRLEHYLGQEVQVGETGMGWPFDLVVKDVATSGFGEPGVPGVRVAELRIGLGLCTRWRVALHRPDLTLTTTAQGEWRPSPFRRLGDLPTRTVVDVSRLAEGFRERIRLRITDGSVRWVDAEGTETASASGVDVRIERVRIPDETAFYYRLSAGSGVISGRAPVSEVRRVWLSVGDYEYIEISRAGGAEAAGGGDFWEPGA